MFDYVIRGGTIIDGTGAPGILGDIAVQDGRIVAVGGHIDGSTREVISADGAIVTPAWIDIHTHYDGQATWDSEMNPSASHGVGTIVMGNCGVGFAPVAADGQRDLIELMEGVEDIPGTALFEGMPWGAWETYPEYLDFLGGREYALNVSSLIAHGAVRNYVMGERGRLNEGATADDLQRMSQIVEEALRAGAVGFSTSRIIGHRSVRGDSVPGTFANDVEVMAIAEALKRAGSGVFQIIPSSTLGEGQPGALEHSTLESEVDLIARVSQSSGRPATFTLFQVDSWSDKWRSVLARVKANNSQGAQVFPQVGSRPTGIVMSLRTYHSFALRPTYLKLKQLPLPELVARLRQPDIKAAILSEENVPHALPGSMENGVANLPWNPMQTFALQVSAAAGGATQAQPGARAHWDYEPTQSDCFAALAARAGQNDLQSFMYDFITGGDGMNMAVMFFTNYSDYNLDAVREMQLDACTVTGLSDAGAHVTVIFDAVNPTYQLTHWARDRKRGATLPLPHVVHRQTQRNAQLFGFHDRGTLAVGMRADINVIDFANLQLGDIELRRDLPAGGQRLLQGASGYLATIINGTLTRRFDVDTGARPGRLIRGGQ